MSLLPVRIPAGNESTVGAVRPGDRPVGVDLAGITSETVGEAAVFEYASTVGAGLSLPPGTVGGPGIRTVSVGNPVPGQYWPRGQDDQS